MHGGKIRQAPNSPTISTKKPKGRRKDSKPNIQGKRERKKKILPYPRQKIKKRILSKKESKRPPRKVPTSQLRAFLASGKAQRGSQRVQSCNKKFLLHAPKTKKNRSTTKARKNPMVEKRNPHLHGKNRLNVLAGGNKKGGEESLNTHKTFQKFFLLFRDHGTQHTKEGASACHANSSNSRFRPKGEKRGEAETSTPSPKKEEKRHFWYAFLTSGHLHRKSATPPRRSHAGGGKKGALSSSTQAISLSLGLDYFQFRNELEAPS